MVRRRALPLLALAAVAWAFSAAAAGARLVTGPLIPLARGHLQVSLGDPPQWLPVSGRPLDLTLFSGRPSGRDSGALNAYLALQRPTRSCAPSAKRGHYTREIKSFYAGANQLAREQSPFAPSGGAAAGDYAATLSGIVVGQRGTTRVCVWLARVASQRGLAAVQDVPLLNGVFAASVSALPTAFGAARPSAYTLNAVQVARGFGYTAVTSSCGRQYTDARRSAADGELATESISFGSSACAGDGTQFTFTTPSGRTFGALGYTVSQAQTAPPQVASLGACELDGLTVSSPTSASEYVQAVGCEVGRLLVSPYQRGVPRGAVLEAQVDGGVAALAPRGTAVDLVLNGRG